MQRSEQECRRILTVMRRLAGIVILLVLIGASGPVMACVTGVAMSHEESACCVAMHRQCGEMTAMKCCRMVAHRDLQQLATPAASLPVQWLVVAQVVAAVPVPSRVALGGPVMDHAPPGLTVARSTVLRI
ncbi:hypothetical protein [Edaphobacter sp.]|uniref:hypothetical protein n=1 Tax=Edaphobacter sp. TaxID=1934404 RepID=UPI002DBD4769|nr:hypothetical protein [Edaphobacter sp.]HEU5342240.1 hypothetical protein [Edaphobacter sp.]